MKIDIKHIFFYDENKCIEIHFKFLSKNIFSFIKCLIRLEFNL